jgi:hypothetical protein
MWNFEDYQIDRNSWISKNTMNDTLYNSDFFPNPELWSKDCSVYKYDENYKISFSADFIYVDTIQKTIYLSGCIIGGWYSGYSSEVIIMTATHIDSTTLLSDRPIKPEFDKIFDQLKFPPPDTIPIMNFKNIDYWYTDYRDKDTCRKVSCKLSYNIESDILYFGQSNSYAELYDLKEIIKKYSH